MHWGWAPRGAGTPAALTQASREPKDPKTRTMEDLRQDMEQEGGGFVTGALNWLSEAATAPKGLLSTAYRAVFLGPLSRTQQDAGSSLEQLAAETDAAVVQSLSTLLLGTPQSTLKLIKRYPAVLDMDRADLMRRLVWLKVRGAEQQNVSGPNLSAPTERERAIYLCGVRRAHFPGATWPG